MRIIINYIRSCFCEHEWDLLGEYTVYNNFTNKPVYDKYIYRCKKCGYAQKVKS